MVETTFFHSQAYTAALYTLRGYGFEHRQVYELPTCWGDVFVMLLTEMCVTWLLQMFPLGLKTLQDPAKASCPFAKLCPPGHFQSAGGWSGAKHLRFLKGQGSFYLPWWMVWSHYCAIVVMTAIYKATCPYLRKDPLCICKCISLFLVCIPLLCAV